MCSIQHGLNHITFSRNKSHDFNDLRYLDKTAVFLNIIVCLCLANLFQEREEERGESEERGGRSLTDEGGRREERRNEPSSQRGDRRGRYNSTGGGERGGRGARRKKVYRYWLIELST